MAFKCGVACIVHACMVPLLCCMHVKYCYFRACRYVEEYHMSDIERELGVDRGRLVSGTKGTW